MNPLERALLVANEAYQADVPGGKAPQLLSSAVKCERWTGAYIDRGEARRLAIRIAAHNGLGSFFVPECGLNITVTLRDSLVGHTTDTARMEPRLHVRARPPGQDERAEVRS